MPPKEFVPFDWGDFLTYHGDRSDFITDKAREVSCRYCKGKFPAVSVREGWEDDSPYSQIKYPISHFGNNSEFCSESCKNEYFDLYEKTIQQPVRVRALRVAKQSNSKKCRCCSILSYLYLPNV